MSRALTASGFALSFVAAAAAGYAALESVRLRRDLEARQLLPATAPGELAAAPDLAGRLDRVERDLAEIRSALGPRAASPGAAPGLPSLPLPDGIPGTGALPLPAPPDAGAPVAADVPQVPAGSASSSGRPDPAPGRSAADPTSDPIVRRRIEEAARAAVTAELEAQRLRQNRNPTLDQVVQTLGLDEVQRLSVEREVQEGQRRVLDVIRTRTRDGHDFFAELTEILALPPAEQGARYRSLVARARTEVVPGTSQTYHERAEAAKAEAGAAIARVLSPEQQAAWARWTLDPTQVQVADSPFRRELFEPAEAARAARERPR